MENISARPAQPALRSGCYRVADKLFVSGSWQDAATGLAAPPEEVRAMNVDHSILLVRKEQLLDAGLDPATAPPIPASKRSLPRAQRPVFLSYASWPDEPGALPAARQVRQVLDEIDGMLEFGVTVLLAGAGDPSRAALTAGCWLARHGTGDRRSRAARRRARLGWLEGDAPRVVGLARSHGN